MVAIHSMKEFYDRYLPSKVEYHCLNCHNEWTDYKAKPRTICPRCSIGRLVTKEA